MARELPRYVIPKPKKDGTTAYYWTLPTYFRKLGCTIHKEHKTALGSDYEAACGEDGKGGKALTLNKLFDEWDAKRLGAPPEPVADQLAKFGTVDWLFLTYRGSNDWKVRVSKRTAPDYERTINILCRVLTKKGDRIGDRMIKAITPTSADMLYEKVRDTPTRKGKKTRPRVAEKVLAISEHAWNVVRRLHPTLFDEHVPNPWEGVAKTRRKHATKPAATREDVYTFAWAALGAQPPSPAAAAAAVICFEWLQRPENVLAGYVTWTGYRGDNAPTQIRIEHHKTGEMVLHPLEDTAGRKRVLFYEEAEEVLAKVPRLGVQIVLRQRPKRLAVPWDPMTMAREVRRIRDLAGLPSTFTLDACRHGGMTELEEAELTDGQGRALSAHKSKAYEGYAKRTEKRALAATRKRHAHRQAEVAIDAPENSEMENSEAKSIGQNL